MVNEIEIIVLVQSREKIEEVLKEYSYVTIVNDYEELKGKFSDYDYMHSRIALIDVKYLTDDNIHLYPYIKKDLMYRATSLVAYGENISIEVRKTLYGVDFKGIIDGALGETKSVIHHVIRRSNLYSSTFANNFVRAMIEYKSIDDNVKKLTYTLDYLIYKYKISNEDALSIRLVLVSLTISFKDENILKFAKILKIIFKSESINKLYENYTKPTTISGKIISILLKINNLKNPSKYFSAINMTNIEPQLIEEIQEVYNQKMLTISSYQDVNFFCEQFNLVVVEQSSSEDISSFNSLFEIVNALMMESLVSSYYFSVSITNVEQDKVGVRLQYLGNTNEKIREYTDNLKIDKHLSIEFIDEYTLSVIFVKDIEEKTEVNRLVDVSNINDQHYSEEEKISAEDFLKEFVVDQSLLDELNENEQDMKNLLFVEEALSLELISQASIVLDRYSHILNETIEFIDLAASLESLSEVFRSVSLDAISDSKKETIRFYIQGLLHDLENWKTYIFIEPNTPDIHYLDASLLENCSEIEKFISSNDKADDETEDDDDDDLDFF